MAKDKILIIEKSEIVKSFLYEKLGNLGFEVIFAKDSFDGLIKMKNTIPDLVIADYTLLGQSKQNFFDEKISYKTISDIPLIIFLNKSDKESVMLLAKYKVYKILTKPIKNDVLFESISEILGKNFKIDETPCMIDIHLNENVLFIEIAGGLNIDKIESIKYKIKELRDLYLFDVPKILIMLIDVEVNADNAEKLYSLLSIVLRYGNPFQKAVKILTSNKDVEKYLELNSNYSLIDTTDDIGKALENLGNININELLAKGHEKPKEDMIFWTNTGNFEKSELKKDENKQICISIIDDDELILDLITMILSDNGWTIRSFNNGISFIESLKDNIPDLIYLDISMPIMNGFEVLANLKKLNIQIPVIIFSTLSQKETVKKALSFGVTSYLVKPVEPDMILKKTIEILNSNF